MASSKPDPSVPRADVALRAGPKCHHLDFSGLRRTLDPRHSGKNGGGGREKSLHWVSGGTEFPQPICVYVHACIRLHMEITYMPSSENRRVRRRAGKSLPFHPCGWRNPDDLGDVQLSSNYFFLIKAERWRYFPSSYTFSLYYGRLERKRTPGEDLMLPNGKLLPA